MKKSIFILLLFFSLFFNYSFANTNVYLEKIGSIGGKIFDIKYKDFYLYAATANGLNIYSLVDTSHIKLVGSYNTQGYAKGIYLKDDLAYITDDKNGLFIIDISEPAKPILKGTYKTNGYVSKIIVQGDYAYIANGSFGLQIINISDTSSPYLVGACDTSGYAYSIKVQDKYAYIADGESGIQIIDISNPHNPSIISTFDPSGQGISTDIAIKDNYAFLADGRNGIHVIDISNQANLSEIAAHNANGDVKTIKILDDYAYIVGNGIGLQIIDISIPSMPTLKHEITENIDNASSLEIHNDTVFIDGNNKGVIIHLDTSNIKNSKVVQTFPYIYNATDFFIKDKNIYITDKETGFHIADITDITNINSVGNIAIEGNANSIVIKDELAYITNSQNGFSLFDIQNPVNIVKKSSYAINGITNKIQIKDKYAYVVDFKKGLLIFDITDTNSPVLKKIFKPDTGNIFNTLTIKDNYLYLLDLSKGLTILDITDPVNPQIKSSDLILKDTSKKMFLKDDLLYVASGADGIMIIDVSSDTNPSIIGRFDTEGSANDIYVQNNFAFIVDGANGLKILDITKPQKSSLIKSYEVRGESNTVQVNQNNIYIANSELGIQVINFSTIPVPPSSFNALSLSHSSIKLTWQDNSDNESGFKIFRDEQLIALIEHDNTTFTDNGLLPDETYRYTIQSTNIAGDSEKQETQTKTLDTIPLSPTNFSAVTINTDTIELSWSDNSNNENSFKIFRDNILIFITAKDVTTYIDINLKPDTTYLYKIKASNDTGDSQQDSAVATTLDFKPNAPANLNAQTFNSKTIKLSWQDKSNNEESFKIYRDDKLIFISEANSVEYTDNGLEPNKMYQYKVSAYNTQGESHTETVSGITYDIEPLAPTNLTAEILNNTSIKLIWSDNSNNETGYKIFKDNELIFTTNKDITSYTDNSIEPNTKYIYSIKAINSAGDSYHDSVTIQTLDTVPSAPGKFKVNNAGSTIVELNWIDNASNENGYKIYKDGKLVFTTETNTISFTDKGLSPNTTYTYEILAFNNIGTSPKKTLTVKTLENIPYAPTSLGAMIQSDHTIKLTWNDNSYNETGFKIFRDDILIFTTSKDTTSFTDTTVKANTKYNYKVKSTNSAGDSQHDSITITTFDTLPATPDNFIVTDKGSNYIQLSWSDNANNETGYKIYRDGQIVFITEANVLKFTDRGLNPNSLYSYEIIAYNIVGVSSKQTTSAATLESIPAAPSNLKTNLINNSLVKLTWEDNSNNESGFKIFRNNELLYTAPINKAEFTDQGLKSNTTYIYQVKATNSAGDSIGIEAPVKTSELLPLPPTNLFAEPIDSTKLLLKWSDNANNENGYKIYRDEQLIFTTDKNITAFKDMGLQSKSTYTYKIKAFNSAGESQIDTFEVSTPDILPNAPTNLIGEVIDSQTIKLTWEDHSNNESGFKIFRDNELIYTSEANIKSYIDKKLEPNSTYSYEIKAVNSAGDSYEDSLIIDTCNEAPVFPSSLIATVIDINRIDLTWSDNSDNEIGFKIYRDGKPVFLTQANITSFSDTGLLSNTNYSYEVKASNSAGNSQSAKVLAKTFDMIPLVPSNFKANVSDDKNIILTWSDNSTNENSFKIYRNDQLIHTTETNTTAFTDTNLNPNTEYTYKVRASNDAGDSFYDSITIKISSPQTIPDTPSNFEAEVQKDNSIKLTWMDNSDDENGFKLYRNNQLIAIINKNEVTFNDTELRPDMTYEYQLKATNYAGDSNALFTSVATNDIIPASPTNLKAEIIDNQTIKLTWSDNSHNESGFKIFRNDQLIEITERNVTTTTHTNLDKNSIYTYQIKAANDTGDSFYDSITTKISSVQIIPAAPSSFKAEVSGNNSIQLTWDDNSDNELGFKLYRNSQLITIVDENLISFNDIDLKPNTTYKYELKTTNYAGDSESVTTFVTIKVENDSVISDLKSEIINNNNIKLSWIDNSDDELGFKIYRDGKLLFITKPNATSYTDEDLQLNKSYTYEIKAVTNNGNSEGVTLIVNPLQTLPIAPTDLKINFFGETSTEGNPALTLTWHDNSDNENGFKIYRNDTLIDTIDKDKISYEDKTTQPNQTYNYQVKAFNNKGEASSEIAAFTTSSKSYTKTESFILKLYKWILKRVPGDEELNFWADQMDKENKTAFSVITEFLESDEYKINSLYTKDYITMLYNVLLDREPDEEGYYYWLDMIENKSWNEKLVFYKFIFSDEFQKIADEYGIQGYTNELRMEAFIYRLYLLSLNREFDESGLLYWKDELLQEKQTTQEAAKAFLFSNEFINRELSEQDFVKTVYRTLLDREPDNGGKSFWLNALSTGITQENIIDNFLETNEFKNLYAINK